MRANPTLALPRTTNRWSGYRQIRVIRVRASWARIRGSCPRHLPPDLLVPKYGTLATRPSPLATRHSAIELRAQLWRRRHRAAEETRDDAVAVVSAVLDENLVRIVAR